jgi:flagellar biosynthetic protein FliO
MEERKNRAFNQNIYLLKMFQPKNIYERIFHVIGSTGNLYSVSINEHSSCTCPDNTQNKNICKHIYFILLRVMKIKMKHMQHSWTKKQLKEIISIIISLAGIVFVLFLTYYCTKWLSIRTTSVSRSKYMNMIDKIPLGPNKYLAIINISNKYCLFGITDQQINFLRELDELNLTNNASLNENPSINIEFNKIISKFIKR